MDLKTNVNAFTLPSEDIQKEVSALLNTLVQVTFESYELMRLTRNAPPDLDEVLRILHEVFLQTLDMMISTYVDTTNNGIRDYLSTVYPDMDGLAYNDIRTEGPL